MSESEELYNNISSLINGINLKLIDLVVSRNKGNTQVQAVVYNDAGTSIDDCSKAHELIQSKLENVFGNDDFSLETASPGTSRVFRSEREYAMFVGRGVRIFTLEEDIIEGTIVSTDEKKVVVKTADGLSSVDFSQIRKTKLDYSQEGR